MVHETHWNTADRFGIRLAAQDHIYEELLIMSEQSTSEVMRTGPPDSVWYGSVGSTFSARDRLYTTHEALCNKALDVMKKKNQDYASAGDPFRNFRMFEALGILVRLSDKLARL